jgi:hypothetical protein
MPQLARERHPVVRIPVIVIADTGIVISDSG